METQTNTATPRAASDSRLAPPASDKLLATDNLIKEYRQRRVVDGVSITVGPGEIVGLLGPNGAGKTTTFNMVVGGVTPDGPAASLQERDIARPPMHQRVPAAD